MSREYPENAIKLLAKALAGEQSASTWLSENDYKELAALIDVMLDENQSAQQWLIKYGHGHLVLFHYSIKCEYGAVEELIRRDEKVWACTVYAANGDADAFEWLQEKDLNHYAYLAQKIYNLLREPRQPGIRNRREFSVQKWMDYRFY